MYLIYIFLSFIVVVSCKTPNIILFLTDDQDLILGSMTPMVKTQWYIADKGVTFVNAFVNAPICCPSRSSILTGRYPHNTRVKNNSCSGNCAGDDWRRNIEPTSVAVSLEEAGYINFYAGKYLNQYGTKQSGGDKYVPKGWHWWYGLVGNSVYFNYTLSENGTARYYNNEERYYLTDVLKLKALDFLNQNFLKQHSFFMILAPPAAHAPFTPASRHKHSFPNVKAPRTPAFNHTPVNKHWLLQTPPIHLPSNVSRLDQIYEHRFQTLVAADEMVAAVVKKLVEIDELDNTYLIYTSDNGFHIGQFGLPWDKRQPYDTDIRVPLLIRGPSLKRKQVSKLPVQLADLAPTILEMAGVEIPKYMDGRSFLKALKLEQTGQYEYAKNILIEYHGEGNSRSNDQACPWSESDDLSECKTASWCKCEDSRNNTYNCVRYVASDSNVLYCEMEDNQNFKEVYDLNRDPYQLNNILSEMLQKELNSFSILLNKLLNCRGESCRFI